MSQLPTARSPYLVRASYGDDVAWREVRDAVLTDANEFGFLPDLVVVDDPGFDGVAVEDLVEAVPADHPRSFLVLVDGQAMTDPAHPVLVVDLGTDVPPFRCLPRAVAEISANLSVSNLDLAELATSVDASGVFRGFWDDVPGASRGGGTVPVEPPAPAVGPRYLVLDLECCERRRAIHRFHAVLLDGAATVTHTAEGLGPTTSTWEAAELDPVGSVEVVCPTCARRVALQGSSLNAFATRYELAFDPGSGGRISWAIDPFLDELHRLGLD